mmetsp:Transcript_33814/g.47174  ORF Transcript_33814/g.47174 Transcript_33814/m.47174 type:complete len:149 (-) Transcript_33814:1629-2075(-)
MAMHAKVNVTALRLLAIPSSSEPGSEALCNKRMIQNQQHPLARSDDMCDGRHVKPARDSLPAALTTTSFSACASCTWAKHNDASVAASDSSVTTPQLDMLDAALFGLRVLRNDAAVLDFLCILHIGRFLAVPEHHGAEKSPNSDDNSD